MLSFLKRGTKLFLSRWIYRFQVVLLFMILNYAWCFCFHASFIITDRHMVSKMILIAFFRIYFCIFLLSSTCVRIISCGISLIIDWFTLFVLLLRLNNLKLSSSQFFLGLPSCFCFLVPLVFLFLLFSKHADQCSCLVKISYIVVFLFVGFFGKLIGNTCP